MNSPPGQCSPVRNEIGGHDEKVLGFPVGFDADGNNSDEYTDTSLGRCGTGDIDDESYIKASHDLLTKSSEDVFRKSSKKLRFSLPDEDLPSDEGDLLEYALPAKCLKTGTSVAASTWIQDKSGSRKRKSGMVHRYTAAAANDSDSDENFGGELPRNSINDRHEQAANSSTLTNESSAIKASTDDSPVSVRPRVAQHTAGSGDAQKQPTQAHPSSSFAAPLSASSTGKPMIMVPLSLIQVKANKPTSNKIQQVNVLSEMNGYICHLCHYSAKLPYLLENHMKTCHLPHQPYVCMECKKGFNLRGTALCHIRLKHPTVGTQMIIDQDVEGRQTEECNKFMQMIIRCHVCDSVGKYTSSSGYAVKNLNTKLYVCATHADSYAINLARVNSAV